NAERARLQSQLPAGTDPTRLKPDQQAELNRLRERQMMAAQQARELAKDLEARAEAARGAAAAKMAEAKSQPGNTELREQAEELQKLAEALEKARQLGKQASPAEELSRAASDVGQNKL